MNSGKHLSAVVPTKLAVCHAIHVFFWLVLCKGNRLLLRFLSWFFTPGIALGVAITQYLCAQAIQGLLESVKPSTKVVELGSARTLLNELLNSFASVLPCSLILYRCIGLS
jgi:hypothetical protein